jgi:transcriptional regulator with XRE-family HTH domain
MDPTFSAWLQAARDQRSWTLKYLAALTGVSAGYLGQLERRPRLRPSPEVIRRIAQAFKTPVAEVAGLVPIPPPCSPPPSLDEWLTHLHGVGESLSPAQRAAVLRYARRLHGPHPRSAPRKAAGARIG